MGLPAEGQREFLVRVRANLRPRYLESYVDRSVLVEIESTQGTRLVREIVGPVRRGGGRAMTVRVWTSLLDWRRYPARELLALYARRWEQEGVYRELKRVVLGSVGHAHLLQGLADALFALRAQHLAISRINTEPSCEPTFS